MFHPKGILFFFFHEDSINTNKSDLSIGREFGFKFRSCNHNSYSRIDWTEAKYNGSGQLYHTYAGKSISI